MDEEIEFLDIDDDIDMLVKKEPKVQVVQEKKVTPNVPIKEEVNDNKTKKAKKKIKKSVVKKMQNIFCCFSALFILGC